MGNCTILIICRTFLIRNGKKFIVETGPDWMQQIYFIFKHPGSLSEITISIKVLFGRHGIPIFSCLQFFLTLAIDELLCLKNAGAQISKNFS